MRLSVELVPRSEAGVYEDAAAVRRAMPEANAFNIPDLTRFSLRSWDACAISSKIFPASIPHIRAVDVPPDHPFPVVEDLLVRGLSEVLIVRGDANENGHGGPYDRTSAEVILQLKKHHPDLKVFAAFDPYRQGFHAELDDVAKKLAAGADGFFTQPIFDLRLLDFCADMLRGHCVFWGITPVLTDRSRAYWEKTNRVVFPSSFQPSLAWNRAFASNAIRAVRGLGANIYLMPIRVNLGDYLTGLVEESL